MPERHIVMADDIIKLIIYYVFVDWWTAAVSSYFGVVSVSYAMFNMIMRIDAISFACSRKIVGLIPSRLLLCKDEAMFLEAQFAYSTSSKYRGRIVYA